MPDISGIDFVNCLLKVPMLVFTTAYSEFAVKGFELDALDYLLKPFSLPRFTKACNKALAACQLRSNGYGLPAENFIFLKTGYQDEKVWLSDLLYVRADGNYPDFVLKDRKIESRLSMSDILKLLPETQFVRIHRSFIVAINKISKIDRYEITLEGLDLKIPIGNAYRDELARMRIQPGLS